MSGFTHSLGAAVTITGASDVVGSGSSVVVDAIAPDGTTGSTGGDVTDTGWSFEASTDQVGLWQYRVSVDGFTVEEGTYYVIATAFDAPEPPSQDN